MYKIAETMADIPKTNIDSLKANMYVIVAYPIPLGFGFLNTNIIEMKKDNIANNIGIVMCIIIVFLLILFYSL